MRYLFGLLKTDAEVTTRLISAWSLMIAGTFFAVNTSEITPTGNETLALILATTLGLSCLIVTKSLGGLYQIRTYTSLFTISLTSYILIWHTLNNNGDSALATLYTWTQNNILALLGKVIGNEVADAFRPMTILTGFILLYSAARRSITALTIPYALVLFCALIPFNLELITGILIWIAGFALAHRKQLHIPIETLESIPSLSSRDELFLRKLRSAPLSQRQTFRLLDDPSLDDRNTRALAVLDKLEHYSDEGLIGFNRESGLLAPTETLLKSDAAPGLREFSNIVSLTSTGILMAIAAVYFTIPLDLVPDMFLTPIGYLDDAIIGLFATLPLLDRIPRLGQFLKRKSGGRNSDQNTITSYPS